MIKEVPQSRNGYGAQLAIFSGLALAGIVVGTIISVIIWFLMTGSAIPTNAQDVMQPKYYSVNMVLQGVSTFFIFFLPTYFFALICYRQPMEYLGFKKSFTSRQLITVIFIIIVTFPLSGGLAAFNKWIPIPIKWSTYFNKIENERQAEEAALIQITSVSKYLISLLGIALLPAMFEETFFRGGLQKLFTNWFKKPFLAIIITSIIFSSIHISYYGFLVRFALGAILGLVYYYSGTIWLNILMHFLFNGIQVTILYLYNKKTDPSHPDIENSFPIWLAIIAGIGLMYLMIRFVKESPPVEVKPASTSIKPNSFEEWTDKTLNN